MKSDLIPVVDAEPSLGVSVLGHGAAAMSQAEQDAAAARGINPLDLAAERDRLGPNLWAFIDWGWFGGWEMQTAAPEFLRRFEPLGLTEAVALHEIRDVLLHIGTGG
jgi:hypothetical protein